MTPSTYYYGHVLSDVTVHSFAMFVQISTGHDPSKKCRRTDVTLVKSVGGRDVTLAKGRRTDVNLVKSAGGRDVTLAKSAGGRDVSQVKSAGGRDVTPVESAGGRT